MEASHPLPIRRVLLAVDLSSASRDAIEEAIELAAMHRADLVVLSVVDDSKLPLPGGGKRRVDQERDRLESGVRAIVRRARDAGVRATHLVWEGDPAQSILDAALSESADVIVLGSHARTGLRRLLVGRTSTEVTRAAACRVLVVAD